MDGEITEENGKYVHPELAKLVKERTLHQPILFFQTKSSTQFSCSKMVGTIRHQLCMKNVDRLIIVRDCQNQDTQRYRGQLDF